MRLPPAKIYRAFPELDRFGDAECKRLVAAATRDARLTATIVPMVIMFMSIWTAPVALGLVVMLLPFDESSSTRDLLLTLVALITCLGFVYIAWLLRARAIRRTIAKRLAAAHCPDCSYSLLGLRAVDGRVRCPECGASVVLADHALAPGYLFAAPSGVPAAAEGRA